MLRKTRTPPIQYLPAFVSAAELGSFAKAADALSVTPSAISQQIKTLEAILGIPLFIRANRSIQLSSAGAEFLQLAQETLSAYESGFANFVERHCAPVLRISMISYIANEVVIPRLHVFSELHPEIDLVIETSMNVENLNYSRLDGAIRFGVPPWENNDVMLVSKVQANLVASQAYLERNVVENVVEYLNKVVIHTRTQVDDWAPVRNAFGLSGRAQKELFFDDYGTAMKAAEEGLGLAIGLFPTCNNAIKHGRLRTLAPQHFPLEEAYYLVSKPNESKRQHIHHFTQWLIEEFKRL